MMKALCSALVKAQAEIGVAIKDATNPHFRSKYADLASVVAAIKPAAAKHGIGYVQTFRESQNGVTVETIIVHESGETMPTGPLFVPASKQDAQGYGSAITYARRYSLQTAFGVPSDDDDGNAAAASAPKHSPMPAALDADPVKVSKVVAAVCDLYEVSVRGDDVSYALKETLAGLEQEEKLAVWAALKSQSKIRAWIKEQEKAS